MQITEFKLGEIAEFINGGAWNQSAYSETGIPVVRVSDIHNYTVDLNDCKYLHPDFFEQYSKHELREGDLVICTVGSHPTQPNSVVGRPGIMPKTCHGALLNQNAVCIRPSTPRLDKEWLSFFARSQYVKDHIISHARGSASQVRVAIGALKDMTVHLPSLEKQKAVATTLKNYDNLIENNNRRIAILEEMAQSLYREWFVKFRFPGHDQCKMVESPLGLIPMGWETKKLLDISTATYGFAFKSKQFNEKQEGTKVVRIRDVPKNDSKTYSLENPKKESQVLKNGDLLIGMDGDFHMGKWAGGHAYLCQRVCKIAPSEGISPYFTFLSFNKPIKDLNKSIVGTTVAHLGDKHLKEITIITATNNIMESFAKIVDPIFKEELNLRLRNQNLKKQRDLLLPKLISGQIDLSLAEQVSA